MSKIKHSGQVFTPSYLVNEILDIAGYSKNIRCRHIIDNSCGDGAFLTEIVSRYIRSFQLTCNDTEQLAVELETYIHGIELDEVAYDTCVARLNQLVKNANLRSIVWDIMNTDALAVDRYNSEMDFVVGNPPYVRVHNLENNYQNVKSYEFAVHGMTDLYLVFFEIGLKMLNADGTLCYIAPSSWINSVAGSNMRHYLLRTHSLDTVVDLEHFQAFDGVMTYTLIAKFVKGKTSPEFDYYRFNEKYLSKSFIDRLSIEDTMIDNVLMLGTKSTIEEYRMMKYSCFKKYASVENGFATLADDVFINDEFAFNQYIIPIIKASTGKWRKAIYPYNKQGKPISKQSLFQNEIIKSYFEDYKKILLKGNNENENQEWYLYGRTQALKDVWKDKWSINTVIKDVSSIKLNFVPSGSGVYSGLYIITQAGEEVLRNIILSEEFIHYVALLKKYKSGGYYTFNTRELELYINFKLNEYYNSHKNDDKPTILDGNPTLF